MHYFKKTLLIFFIINTTSYCFCQNLIKGKIVDIDNNSPLPFTLITNIKSKANITSDIDGIFELNEAGIYSFKKEGYAEKTLGLKTNRYYIIQLNINPSELNEVVINTNHIPKKLIKATSSISVIHSSDIKQNNNTDFSPILNRKPGVFMQSGALNTNRITIRGIGSRNAFGTSKIRAYFKGIPLTNGSGSTTIEDFELASISRIEIIKGAASSIYGAGLGGTINLTPQNAYLNNSAFISEISIGSFGLVKGIVNMNHGSTKNSYKAIYSNTHSDGYRNNNNYNRQTFNVTSNHFISNKNDITFLGCFVDLKAFIPSSLNKTNYTNNPESAAFTWAQAKGFEDSKRGIFGVSWNHKYHGNLKQVTSVFTSFRNAYEPRPFNILKENLFAIGARTRLLGKSKLFNRDLNWTFGGEFFRDNYTYSTFENLYEEFPEGHGSEEGSRLSNFKEKRNYYNVFTEGNYDFSKKTTLSIGINLNNTGYKLYDNFPVSDTDPDQSGNFKFNTIVSPKIGISHLLAESMSVFSNVSHGFSPISLEETLLPDGQINTELKPETGWNYEIGTRGSILKNRLYFSASIYQLEIKNLLVSRRLSDDQYIGINAGQTTHKGLELDLNYKWTTNKALTIKTFLNYTLNNFTFKEFIDDENNFSGNDLTGVPSEIFNTGINLESKIGLYGNINFQNVGSMPITDSNSLYSNKYNLTNLKTGFRTNFNKNIKLNVFLGINNIFDEAYASQILINASGFGGNEPRYYYPGNPVNYYTGINVNYTF